MRTEMGCLERRTLGAKLIILPMAASPLEHVALPKGQRWPTSCWQSCSLLLILLPSCARRKVVRAAAFALLLSLHSPGSSYSLGYQPVAQLAATPKSLLQIPLPPGDEHSKHSCVILSQLCQNALLMNREGYFGYLSAVLGTANSHDQSRILTKCFVPTTNPDHSAFIFNLTTANLSLCCIWQRRI